MSSHHFVREGQEPALIIVDSLSLELAEPLLEWVPLVIVLDHILEDIRMWGIKVDVVVSYVLNEVQIREILPDQFPLQIIRSNSENPIVSALKFLSAGNQSAVNLMMQISDERFKLLEKFPQLSINVIDRTEKWSLCHQHFEKWVPANSVLKYRKIELSQDLDFTGLIHTGHQANSVQDGVVSVRSSSPFWVGEAL